MVNAKALKTRDIQTGYDIVEATLAQHPNLVPSGTTLTDYVTSLIEQALKDINHAMRASAGRILETHRTAVQNGKTTKGTVNTATDIAKDFANQALGALNLSVPTAPASNDENTPEAAATTAAPTARAGTYTIIDGKAKNLDTIVQTITGNDALRIETFFAILDGLEADMAAAEATLRDLQAAIDTKGDVTAVERITPSPASGLASLPTDHPMVESLNDLLAAYVTPAISWEAMIAKIGGAEDALKEAVKKETTMRRKGITKRAPVDANETVDTNADVVITMTKGLDLFPSAYGGATTLLSFDVPVMDVADPDVPEIDPTYKFFVPVLTEALHAIASNEIVWLYGDSGCGKSEFWKQVAARLGMPFTRLNMDGHLTRSDIIGVNRMVPNADRQMEMRFIDGILPRAMAKPGLLLIDELDLGDPEIMAVLQPVLEGEPLRVLEDHGRVVRPHPHFRIAITGNTTGLGSATNAYVNAYEQSAATRDRIAAYIEMPYMTPQIEKQVIQERMPNVPDAFLDKLIQLANAVRTGYRQNDVNQIFSTRSTLAAARRYLRFAPLYANEEDAIQAILDVVILNRMDEPSRNAVKGYIDNIFA